ncbi:MAG: heme-binding protein [Rhizobiales bacterium]|nr:heme-binding protein [Hyphomicrobiales bacterium]
MSIKLAKANAIIRSAYKKSAELQLKPLTVAVLDAGGHLVALQRADGASIMRPQIANGKAYGALAMGMGSASLETAFKERPHFGSGLNAVAPQGIIPVGGGVLIRNKRGEIIGAVGITGDTSDNDTTCAVAGIEAAGLVADPG